MDIIAHDWSSVCKIRGVVSDIRLCGVRWVVLMVPAHGAGELLRSTSELGVAVPNFLTPTGAFSKGQNVWGHFDDSIQS